MEASAVEKDKSSADKRWRDRGRDGFREWADKENLIMSVVGGFCSGARLIFL